MPTAFLSHSSTDKDKVRRIAHYLRDAGIHSWIDEAEIRVGDSLITKISNAIEQIDVVVVILSRKSVTSQWVRKELEWAMTREINSSQVVVLPVVIETVDVPLFIRDKLYLDLSAAEDLETGVHKLGEDIHFHCGSSGGTSRSDATGSSVITSGKYRSPALLLTGFLSVLSLALMFSLYFYQSVAGGISGYADLMAYGMTFGCIALGLCAADVFRLLLIRGARETNPRIAADFDSVSWTSLFFSTYRTILFRHSRNPYVVGILAVEILTLIGISLMVLYAAKIIQFAIDM